MTHEIGEADRLERRSEERTFNTVTTIARWLCGRYGSSSYSSLTPSGREQWDADAEMLLRKLNQARQGGKTHRRRDQRKRAKGRL